MDNLYPIIAGVTIVTDNQGRFNLNALHKASRLGDNKKPSEWLRLLSTNSLINELSENSHLGQEVIKSNKGGINPGTFAHELLAISYAGWISPAFQLQVNQTFIDYRTSKQQSNFAIPQSLPEALRLAADLADKNQQLEHKVDELVPKAQFHDQVTIAHGTLTLNQAAKILNTGRTRLCSYLKRKGWLTRTNEPYQTKIDQGLLDTKLSNWEHPQLGLQRVVTTLVTGKGLAKLSQMMRSEGDI